jgi:hypothetical protein
MVRTNLQEFVGDVHVLSNLQVGSNLFANDLAANVLTIAGNVAAEYFIGDGGFLSNIATTLDDIISNPNGNSVSNTVVFISGQDPIANTAIVTYANVGISVSNTNPTGEYQLSIGSNIFVNTHASNVLTIIGSVGANTFIGDGGLLSNIATTLDAIIDQGNTVSNTIQLISGADVTSNTGLVTHKDVGISVSNTEPTGEFQFGVGSNLLVNVYSSNVLAIEGNVNAQKMTLGTITVTSAYGLNHVTAQGSVTGDTISLTNATTGLTADSNIVVGGNVTAETVITSANVEVGDRLKFASNVFVDDLRVADVAANLVTYDKTTGELMDSGGLFANKLAVVSVQPPSALSANTTTIAKHGTYTVTTSGLESTSNAWNAFDGDSAVEWKSIFVNGRLYDAGGIYTGSTRLATTTKEGEWLAIEFPYKTTLRHMKLTPPATTNQYPASANVYATNDSLTWTEVVNWSDVNPGDQQSNVQTIIVNATESFKKYAMVVTKANGGNDNVALTEWKLFTESFSIDGGKVEMATSAVMGGETTMDQHGPHSRDPKAVPLKKYPEIVFEEGKFDYNGSTRTYVQAGYRVTATSSLGDSGTGPGYQPWGAFNGTTGIYEDAWVSQTVYSATAPGAATASAVEFPVSSGRRGEYIDLQMPNAIKVASFVIKTRSPTGHFIPEDSPGAGYLYGSNNGTAWTEIKAFSGLTYGGMGTDGGTQEKVEVNSTVAYKYLRLQGTHRSGVSGTDQYLSIGQIEYYGYEEDPPAGDTSVDTTFTSIMNTPQTTGANVYVDGSLGETLTNRVTGPDATGPSATYDATGKYWELNGSLESNIAVEANTFLSGDQPHAVSVWFNSSNLEANVSNTCVFSVSDQEKLDSMNLDLQSNTWHNLTYAYQGEGGSRVTYLDGRKVAEDQAEDTFGDYPPFAMTGYSQGGYVVEVSTDIYSSFSYYGWGVFSDGAESGWHTGEAQNSGGNCFKGSDFAYGVVSPYSPRRMAPETPQGEFLKLTLPNRIILNYVTLTAVGSSSDRSAEDFEFWGSDTGVDGSWNLIKSFTGESQLDTGSTYIINATKSYKYIGFIITRCVASESFILNDISYYGHRENDLVRLPDPTNVLKYPHIAMTGPAQRGYVASASSTAQAPYLGFTPATSASAWVSGNTTDYDGANNDYNATTYRLGALVGGGNTEYGEWLKLELPHKLAVNKMILTADPGGTYGINEAPDAWKIYGSNDDTNWVELLSVTGATPTTSGDTRTISNSTAYKYLAIVITSVHNITAKTRVGGLEYYGTGVDSIPIQIGGGNIDKVANFRVYDKFVGEDQALEIWDAQKDEFRGVKNSVTLHKGRLGIGTTEPEGRLAVLDEPHNLEEFPPRAMTGYETHVEGHGVFKASASMEYTRDLGTPSGTNDTSDQVWHIFDKIGHEQPWTGGDDYSGTGGTYQGIYSTGGISGDFVELKLPYKINVKQIELTGWNTGTASRFPEKATVVGSNDGLTWETVGSWTGASYTQNYERKMFIMSSSKYYSVYRLVITETVSSQYTTLGQIRYFGTREQGQSVLHDGQLTLTKSLNVPRIGPALDADDTPRRDRLVVEYNTSTNPTFEGAVRDTSGRGNDGVFVGGASYDATEKALVFDGTASDQYVHTLKNGTSESGNIDYSVSLWFNPTTVNVARWRAIFAIGVLDRTQPTDNNGDEITFFVRNGSDVLHLQNGASSVDTTDTVKPGQWVHIVVTYDGTNRKIYLDGSLSISNGYTSLNLPKEMLIRLAQSMRSDGSESDEYMDCKISNFKTWFGAALTAEEVKTLYDMGRCDEGHHVVNFSKTRVGIGLGDGEAPRGALDVRDEVYINKQVGPLELRQVVDNTPLQSFIIRAATSGFGYWGMYVTAGNDFSFHQNGSDRGALVSGVNVSAIDFTGQHRNFIDGVSYANYDSLEGLIVSANKNKYYDIDENITAGANAIQISQSLPLVALSNVALDKACFGVISGVEDPDTRKYEQGTFVTVLQKQRGDRRAFINSVGEGAIWVVNTNGSLESGDYITTSNVAGYGQKQNDDVLHNYTVAKITMDCDFEPVTQPVQQILRSNVVETYYLGNVHKVKSVPHEFVTTVVSADDDWSNVSVSPSDVTYAEWSNLEANTQNTYTLTYTQTSNVVYDTKYTLTTTANVTESDAWDRVFIDPPNVSYAEYSNLEANTQNTYTLTFTQTTTDTKTPEEWSALESNTQSLYNKVYYQSVEEEVAATWPGAVAHTRVTDVIENELDEHGQIQWEDHPTETEKAYKIRYLDASGAQTDSANAVHIAAFVGCTYHCG